MIRNRFAPATSLRSTPLISERLPPGFEQDGKVVTETKKVVWPSRNEALQMTGYVFAFVFAMALFLWLTDKTLEWAIFDLVLGWRR